MSKQGLIGIELPGFENLKKYSSQNANKIYACMLGLVQKQFITK